MAYIGNSPETTYSINVKEYVATAGQTIFPAVYGAFVEVYVNGLLLASTDYIATDGVQVILNVGATAGDEVRINGYADIATASGLVTSVAGRVGDVVLTKADVGLANVDNTADVDKPVSTAQATAIGLKQDTLVSGTNIKTINGSSVLGSGDIAVGAIDTNIITTSTSITMTKGNHYNVTTAGLTLTLPTTPTTGDKVVISVGDFSNTTVARNGQTIGFLAENLTIDRAYITIELQFLNSTWRIV